MSVELRLCDSNCGTLIERKTKEKGGKRFTKKIKNRKVGVEETVKDRGEGIQRAVSY